MDMDNRPNLELDIIDNLADSKHDEAIVVDDEIKMNEEAEVIEEKPKRKRKARKTAEEPKEILANAEEVNRTWKSVFISNYSGVSEEAKSVEKFVKENYKGNKYLPWATMERLTYMCDPEAKFENIYNNYGALVHTDYATVDNISENNGKKVETHAQMYSHFVRVKLTFMGKEFVEDYPIQDTDYSALKVYNQNAVNKALQRAKAKIASRATGIGLKLYEGSDLQFDEPSPKPKTNTSNKVKSIRKEQPKVVENVEVVTKEEPKAEVKVETKPEVKEQPKVEENVSRETVVENSGYDEDINNIIRLFRETEPSELNVVLQRINMTVVKKYGFALTTNDTDAELAMKISKFPNPSQFYKSLKIQLGL